MSSNKPTLVLGASLHEHRYSNKAIHFLRKHQHTTYAVGARAGEVAGVAIAIQVPDSIAQLHTITIYMGAERQRDFFEKIIALHPQRVIFNPGAECEELVELLSQKNIESIEACTLVMLSTGQY